MSNTLEIINSKGHTTMTWDPKDEKSIERVKTTFTEYLHKRWAAFKLQGKKEGTQIEDFDEVAHSEDVKVLMMPPMAGGC